MRFGIRPWEMEQLLPGELRMIEISLAAEDG